MKEIDQTKQKRKARNSIALLHISVMLFGLSAVVGQFVDAPAGIIAWGRVVCSSAALLIFSLLLKSKLTLNSAKDYGIAVFTGVILAIHWTTFFQSIQSSSVAIGTITFSAFPLFLTFLEPIVFREKLRLQSVVSALFLLLGVVITVPSFSLENQTTWGIVWGLISALAYAVMSLSNRYLSRWYEARTICLYEQGTAAVVLLPALFVTHPQWTAQNVVGIAIIGLVCTAVGHSLYVAAQKNVTAHIGAGFGNHQHADQGDGVRPQHHRDVEAEAQHDSQPHPAESLVIVLFGAAVEQHIENGHGHRGDSLSKAQRNGVVLQSGGAQRQRAGNQVEGITGAQHHRHPAEQTKLGVAFAAADHQNADGDHRDQINGVKQGFYNCLHSSFSFALCCIGNGGKRRFAFALPPSYLMA